MSRIKLGCSEARSVGTLRRSRSQPTPPTQTSSGAEPDAARRDAFPFRVLLAVPEALTIPIFALGVEARREPIEAEVVEDGEALSRLVGAISFASWPRAATATTGSSAPAFAWAGERPCTAPG